MFRTATNKEVAESGRNDLIGCKIIATKKMKEEVLTLENSFYAYLFGLIQTDGHLYQNSRNRGRLSIELGKRDEALLFELQKRLPFNSTISERTRRTNFSSEYVSVIWNVFDKRFRDFLVKNGIPSGRKSNIISTPVRKYSEVDYFRGLIDGDGSLGLTAKGFPFLSLVSASSEIANEYIGFLKSITGKEKTAAQNKRDNVFNIAVYKEDAQKVVTILYYENCLALPRKIQKAKDVLNWQRPISMKRIENRKRWTDIEDNFILSNSINDAVKKLDRSQSSIEMRLWRLKSSSQLVTD
ncbi:MAG: LAGLIDADG family homing endonuclease [Pyrinomonadaceae bacterium]|nr:LAGLIDADG family homing endonuclease [Pyrinomonadaceae bacterium]